VPQPWPSLPPLTRAEPLVRECGGKASSSKLYAVHVANLDAVFSQYLWVLWKYGIWILILNFKPAFCVKEICGIIAYLVTIWLCTTFTQYIQDHTRFLPLCCFIPLTCNASLVRMSACLSNPALYDCQSWMKPVRMYTTRNMYTAAAACSVTTRTD